MTSGPESSFLYVWQQLYSEQQKSKKFKQINATERRKKKWKKERKKRKKAVAFTSNGYNLFNIGSRHLDTTYRKTYIQNTLYTNPLNIYQNLYTRRTRIFHAKYSRFIFIFFIFLPSFVQSFVVPMIWRCFLLLLLFLLLIFKSRQRYFLNLRSPKCTQYTQYKISLYAHILRFIELECVLFCLAASKLHGNFYVCITTTKTNTP